MINQIIQKIMVFILTVIISSNGFYVLAPVNTQMLEILETVNSEAKVETIDERAERIDAYFEKRGMPLTGYGAKFVEVADKYGIDWRLLPAIGVRESSGGKHLMNNNPFGWGSAKIPFTDFNDAIEVVAYNLSGNNPNTARYYKDTDSYKKLWYYNGTVMPTYPDEVIAIMNMM
jgi:hypothetical protein